LSKKLDDRLICPLVAILRLKVSVGASRLGSGHGSYERVLEYAPHLHGHLAAALYDALSKKLDDRLICPLVAILRLKVERRKELQLDAHAGVTDRRMDHVRFVGCRSKHTAKDIAGLVE
jgi:hypothetical protein